MRRICSVVMALVIILGLAGCGGAKSSITAEDYDTRLMGMAIDMNELELSEISTDIIGANKKEFDEISGWYADKDIIDRDVLMKKTLLDGRLVEIEMRLNGNRVSEVTYSYEDAIFEDFLGYISFNVMLGIESPISLSSEKDGDGKTVFRDISDEEMNSKLVAFADTGKDFSFSCSWEYTSKNDASSKIQFSYYATNISIGNLYLVAISYQLA